MIENRLVYLLRDFAIIAISILVALIFVKTGVVSSVLQLGQGTIIISGVLAGIFFISAFTAAPAAVILVELMKVYPPVLVAFLAGSGALFGDLIIFSFVRDALTKDIFYIAQKLGLGDARTKFQNGHLRFVLVVIGAFIVASPFPDEVGLALMGLSQMKKINFIPVSFALNFIGILTFGLVVRNLM